GSLAVAPLLAGRMAPEPRGAFGSPGAQRLAVAAEGPGSPLSGVSPERGPPFVRGDFPQLNPAILAARRNRFPVRAEGHGEDPSLGDVPDLLSEARRLADQEGRHDDQDTHPGPIRTHGEASVTPARQFTRPCQTCHGRLTLTSTTAGRIRRRARRRSGRSRPASQCLCGGRPPPRLPLGAAASPPCSSV